MLLLLVKRVFYLGGRFPCLSAAQVDKSAGEELRYLFAVKICSRISDVFPSSQLGAVVWVGGNKTRLPGGSGICLMWHIYIASVTFPNNDLRNMPHLPFSMHHTHKIRRGSRSCWWNQMCWRCISWVAVVTCRAGLGGQRTLLNRALLFTIEAV